MSFFSRDPAPAANPNPAPNPAPAADPANPNSDPGGENNQEGNLPLNTNMWDNIKSGNENPPAQPAQSVQPAAQPQQTVSPAEAMQQHIASLDLNANVDLQAISTELQEGKTEALQVAFDNMAANTYKAAVLNTNRLMETKIAEAVETAVKQANGTVNANLAEQEMHKMIPMTSQPDVSPIAKAVLTKMIEKSGSVNEAIQGVEKFFKAVSNAGAEQFTDLPVNQPRPGQDPFGNNPQPKVDDDYYLDLLSGS